MRFSSPPLSELCIAHSTHKAFGWEIGLSRVPGSCVASSGAFAGVLRLRFYLVDSDPIGIIRTAIVDALLEDRETRRHLMLVYFTEPFNEFLAKRGSTIQPEVLHARKDDESWLTLVVSPHPFMLHAQPLLRKRQPLPVTPILQPFIIAWIVFCMPPNR